MITAKILILVATLGAEYITITSILEYFDKKKYEKEDAEFYKVMEQLKSMKKEVV